MSEQYELTLNDYLAIAKRRWLYLLLPFVLVLLGSIGVALWAPPVYESSGTILVESQQIPDELVRSMVTSYADERIQVITQTVMTRENLLRIVDKFNLFSENRKNLTPSELVDLMRRNIKISRQSTGSSRPNNRNSNTLTFSIGFESSSPGLALSVTNELFTLFLDENLRTRAERASIATEFMLQEANRLRRDLVKLEDQIAEYKRGHSSALPENRDLHQKMLERTEAGIKDIDRAITESGDELRFLEIELSAVNVGAASATGRTSYATPGQSLAAAEAELVALQAQYTELHPDVRKLKRQIEELRAGVATSQSEGDSGAGGSALLDIDTARIQARIDSVNERVNSLREQKRQLEANRQELEGIILQTPIVERELVSLTRDYQNISSKYEEVQRKQMEAELAESMEEGKKAETFSRLENPTRPDKPVRPNRKKIVAMGFLLALASSFGLTTLLEMGDKRIRGADALAAILNERPLVAIPYISNNDEIRRAGKLRKWLIAVVIVSIPVALAAIHFLYMPLDLLVIKIVARFG